MSSFKYERYENEEDTDQDTRQQKRPDPYTLSDASGKTPDGYMNNVTPQQGYGPYLGQQAQQFPYAVPQQPYGFLGPATTFDQTGRAVTSQPVVQQVIVRSPFLEDPPPDYLGLNILACLCCCWMIGICGIIKSVATRDAIARGDEEGAKSNSACARSLAIASMVVGAVLIVIFVVLKVVVFTAETKDLDTETNENNYYR